MNKTEYIKEETASPQSGQKHAGGDMVVIGDDKMLLERLHEIGDLEKYLKGLVNEAETRVKEAARRAEAAQRLESDVARIIEERTLAFPWLADAISQYYEMCDHKIAEFLENKLQPGISAANRVRELAGEKRMWQKRFRLARNRVRYYEHLFPWLEEFVGEGLDELGQQVECPAQMPEGNEADPVSKYLTKAEYESLSSAQRNQLALDRYWQRRKAPWELGRDYERFVGYWHESRGFAVHYQGIVEGLQDLGRDLIAKKGDETLIIQCKRWRTEKVIREKHVFQLFGTTVEYCVKEKRHMKVPKADQMHLFVDLFDRLSIGALLITTTKVSPEAREFANVLGVRVMEQFQFDPEYPCIKCNVSHRTGEQIYHLPLDQQYDATTIDPARGERYVRTVSEAENLGFRRAWRWHPDATGGG